MVSTLNAVLRSCLFMLTAGAIAAKISIDAFASSFFRVTPPNGWGKKIGGFISANVEIIKSALEFD